MFEPQAHWRCALSEHRDAGEYCEELGAVEAHIVFELGGDELAIVGELSFDHPRGEAYATDADGRLLLAQGDVNIGVLRLPREAGGFGHCARRQNRLAYILGRRVERHGAHGEPVAVGGRHSETVWADTHKNAGEHRAGLVAGCGAHDAVSTGNEALGGDGEPKAIVGRKLWVLPCLMAIEAE